MQTPQTHARASQARAFSDRRDAGRRLASLLAPYRGRTDVIVLGLPRGGVPVAYEVARALHVPLDVFVVRKLGMPGHEELAIGALASGGARFVNEPLVARTGIRGDVVDAIARREACEIVRREERYRARQPALVVERRTVILVDDGLATGASMRAAVLALRELGPTRIVVAVPVGAIGSCNEMHQIADEVVCYASPEPFRAVGLWYEDFNPTTDDEVTKLLQSAREQSLA
jgi:predicted phosphoribosyltransferase